MVNHRNGEACSIGVHKCLDASSVITHKSLTLMSVYFRHESIFTNLIITQIIFFVFRQIFNDM